MPLHVFEERYRTLTREALAGDGKIAIALLREGWEADYENAPAVHEVACLGKIEKYEELEDGKYNIVLAGTHRVRLLREVRRIPYRLAEVQVLDDVAGDELGSETVGRRNHLGGLFTRFTELATGGKYRSATLVPQLDFEGLVNMVAAALSLPAEDKQALLEMDDLAQRCDAVIPAMQRQLEAIILVRKHEHLKPEDPSRN